jgi:rod shape-determining protein MreD
MPPAPALTLPSWRRAFLTLAVALIAQTTVLHSVGARGGTISFVFLVVLWFATAAGTAKGALFGLIAGACEDALAGATGAAWTVATPLSAALAARIVRGTGWDHPLFLGLVTGCAAISRSLLAWFVLRLEHLVATPGEAAMHAALWSATLDALVAGVATTAFRSLRPLRVDRR